MVGSCAAGHREPGQVWKEAALSGMPRAPWGCLAGAGDSESTVGRTFEGRGTITLPRSGGERQLFAVGQQPERSREAGATRFLPQ